MTDKEDKKEAIIAAIIVLAIVGVVVALINGWISFGQEEQEGIYIIAEGNDPALGNEEAPVTIIEFSDFSCIYCATFHNQSKETLRSYVDAGTVRFVFKDFPLTQIHPKAAQVAKAAGCAYEQGNEYFWTYHDFVYENIAQQEISHLRQYAEQTELNMTLFDSCFASDRRYIEIQQDTQEARELGITGTPTFFVNGKLYRGILSPGQLDEAVTEALERG